ncbi:MAG: hypothetical protein KC713_07475, partial [Candidatus Omnitrophica bacterium]|nr:hypothetical protein [Candidatus Omnitrophota bacterium]
MAKDDRYYNIETLNKWFAIVALILLFALMGLFAKDYNRKWKDHQKEFKQYEVEKSRVKFDKVSLELEDNQEYQALLKELEALEQTTAAECAQNEALAKEIDDMRAKENIVQQKYKFTKAELDAAKYRFEYAKENTVYGVNLDALRENYLALAQAEKDLAVEVETIKESLNAKTKQYETCRDKLEDLKRQERRIASKRDLIQRKLESIDPNAMGMTNRIANLVRDLPVIDLANPSVKIQQIVLKDITEDVNFAQVPKVERCTTCHLGIDNPDYINAPQPYRTHPNLEEYVGKDSAHPMEEFGCTTCHAGRARG